MPKPTPKKTKKPTGDSTPNKTEKKRRAFPYNNRSQIVMVVEGIPIRNTNIISIYIPKYGMAELAKIVAATGMSFAKALGYSASPCECCKGKPVVIEYNGQTIEIPRGILNANREEIGNKKQRRK